MRRKSEVLNSGGGERFRQSRRMKFVMLAVFIVVTLDCVVLAVSTYRRIEKLIDISVAVLMLSIGVIFLCSLISALREGRALGWDSSLVYRTRNPIQYWLSIAIQILMVIVVALTAYVPFMEELRISAFR